MPKIVKPKTKTNQTQVANEPAKVKNWSCPSCSTMCATRGNLESHIMHKHERESKPYRCSDCDYCSVKSTQLLEHVRAKHVPRKELTEAEKRPDQAVMAKVKEQSQGRYIGSASPSPAATAPATPPAPFFMAPSPPHPFREPEIQPSPYGYPVLNPSLAHPVLRPPFGDLIHGPIPVATSPPRPHSPKILALGDCQIDLNAMREEDRELGEHVSASVPQEPFWYASWYR